MHPEDIDMVLTGCWGYNSQDIVLLTDDSNDRRQIPTGKKYDNSHALVGQTLNTMMCYFFSCALTLPASIDSAIYRTRSFLAS